MRILEFQIYNYMSYGDSGATKLAPGFNLFLGQNDSGKSALLSAASLRLKDAPHRTLATAPSRGVSPPPISKVRVVYEATGLEILDLLPIGTYMDLPREVLREGRIVTDVEKLLSILTEDRTFQFEADFLGNGNVSISQEHQMPEGFTVSSSNEWVNVHKKGLRKMETGGVFNGGSNNGIAQLLANRLKSSIHAFRAERMKVGRSRFGPNSQLAPDAQNLPEVLSVLQGNPSRFDKYNQLVKRVFPGIRAISVTPAPTNQEVEVMVWSLDPDSQRDDLAVSLLESGTGVAQVLSILSVLVASEEARIIVIDEPNSFLHPGAVRSMMDILAEDKRHQYIIASHTSDLLRSANGLIYVVNKATNGKSEIKSVNPSNSSELRNVLADLGTRLSDVLASERVLWVEGPTEQECFSVLVRKLLKIHDPSLSIVSVLSTGDFDSRDPDRIYSIYHKLSSTVSAFPTTVGFIFDRETRPAGKRDDLKKRSGGSVSFLPRRMYENYLLHSEAIAAVLNSELSVGCTAQQVNSELEMALKSTNVEDAHGAQILGDIFWRLSGERLEYSKVQHGLRLTNWLIEHAPSSLTEVVNIIETKLRAEGARLA